MAILIPVSENFTGWYLEVSKNQCKDAYATYSKSHKHQIRWKFMVLHAQKTILTPLLNTNNRHCYARSTGDIQQCFQ